MESVCPRYSVFGFVLIIHEAVIYILRNLDQDCDIIGNLLCDNGELFILSARRIFWIRGLRGWLRSAKMCWIWEW